MYYIVQDNLFRWENHLDHTSLQQHMDRLGLEYETVRVLPFIDTIDFKTQRKDVFAFGALKMAKISKQYDWKPGILMTPNHDYEVYKNYYKEHLLNYDSKVIKIKEDFEWDIDQYFIRPTQDTKSFTGKVFEKNEWKDYRKYLLTNGHETTLTEDTHIQVAIPKLLYKEIRFFIVGGKISTCSQYRLGYNIILNSIVDRDAYDFVNNMIKIYQLAEAFVMDVALTKDGWKIIELGCISCAGFFKSDVQKLLIDIDTHFSNK